MYFAIRRSDDGQYWWRAVGDNNEIMAASGADDQQAELRALDPRDPGPGRRRAGAGPERGSGRGRAAAGGVAPTPLGPAQAAGASRDGRVRVVAKLFENRQIACAISQSGSTSILGGMTEPAQVVNAAVDGPTRRRARAPVVPEDARRQVLSVAGAVRYRDYGDSR